MRRPRPGRRGSTAFFALVLVAVVTVVLATGQEARISELGSEARPRCRLQARLAAESAIARGLARLDAGRSPGFPATQFGPDAAYSLAATPSSKGWSLQGTGTCRRPKGGESRVQLEVLSSREQGRWRVKSWVE